MTAPTVADREAQVLQQRAAELARASTAVDTQPQALEFSVAGHDCLLELAWLDEVRPVGELAHVPLAVPPVIGLVHLRGRMLAVLDLAAALGLPASPPSSGGQLLVLGRGQARFCVAGVQVRGLRSASPAQAQQRSTQLDALRPDTVLGVTATGHLFLDGERLLALHAPAAGP